MITTKEFNGSEFHAFCQQQYDAARRFLKTCGRPACDVDRFLIDQCRVDTAVFGGMLDSMRRVKLLSLAQQAKEERESLLKRVAEIDTMLLEFYSPKGE